MQQGFAAKVLSNFLQGDKSCSATTDNPHNCKNRHYLIIGLNIVVAIGKYVMDIGMLSILEEELI